MIASVTISWPLVFNIDEFSGTETIPFGKGKRNKRMLLDTAISINHSLNCNYLKVCTADFSGSLAWERKLFRSAKTLERGIPRLGTT